MTLKVIVALPYTTHYYNPVLNRINNIQSIEVVMITDKEVQGGITKGGINQTESNVKFRIIKLPKYKKNNLIFCYKKFIQTLIKERPDILIITEEIAPNFAFNPVLKLAKIILGFKVVLKTIPYQIPTYKNSLERKFSQSRIDSFPHIVNQILIIFRIEKIYRIIYTLKQLATFRSMDAHVNYIEDAFAIFGSYGVSSNKIFITKNSPDTDLLKEAEKRIISSESRKTKKKIVHVGRLVKWKRVDLLIQATHLLTKKHSDLELLVIGDGIERDNLEKLSHSLNMQNRVKFIGGIYDYIDLGKILLDCDLYVLAGVGGLSINDAMFFKLPIICSSCDGTEKMLLKNGENGLFFEENNLQDLANKIDQILSDPIRMKKMGLKSREIIESEVNIHSVIGGYINCFQYLFPNFRL